MIDQVVPPFNIMCKPVCGTCNLDCCYCYYTMKPGELYPGVEKFQMTDEVLESYTRQYIEAMPVRCEFGWQGGEPTLAGLDFFKRAIELQKKYAGENQVITNALQTNGTLLTEDWCEFLHENNFLVGISMDGPPQWHDTFRRDHANRPTYHRVWKGVELLRDHHVEFNVLVTLNSANAPHAGDIYRYFVNRGIPYVQFIPILERTPDGEPTDFSCTAEQFGKFMIDVFDLWRRRDVGKVSERLIDCVLHTMIFGKASTCCYADRCANAHIVEWNGDVYVCDHFVYKEWCIGNLTERPLIDLLQDAMLEDFAQLKLDLPTRCQQCEYVHFCRGGCPKHHRPIGTDPDRFNHFCDGLKTFFQHALPELERMAPYIERGEIPPMPEDADPAVPGSQARAMPGAPTREAAGQPPGRNAPCPCGSGRKFKQCCGRN